jgi:hypothetical protein
MSAGAVIESLDLGATKPSGLRLQLTALVRTACPAPDGVVKAQPSELIAPTPAKVLEPELLPAGGKGEAN